MKSGSCPLKAERVFSHESRRKQFDFSRRGDLGHAPAVISRTSPMPSSVGGYRSMPSGQNLPLPHTGGAVLV